MPQDHAGSTGRNAEQSDWERWSPLLAGAIVAVVTALSYGGSFRGPFIFDDEDSITANPYLRHSPFTLKGFQEYCLRQRPVADITFKLNYEFSSVADHGVNEHGYPPGLHEWSYHAVNLLIHVLAALALFGIVRRTLLIADCRLNKGPPGRHDNPQSAIRESQSLAPTVLATAVALVWAVHPLQTESVAYIVQRSESLMGLFYLLTLYCAIRGLSQCATFGEAKKGGGEDGSKGGSGDARIAGAPSRANYSSAPPVLLSSRLPIATSSHRRHWYALAVIACALGMGTKQVMVTAPLMVLLYDRTFVSGTFRKALARSWRLYAGLAATWAILAALMMTGSLGTTAGAGAGGFTPWTYLATQVGVVIHYLRLAVWPAGLCLDYGWPEGVQLGYMHPLGPVLAFIPAAVLVGVIGLSAWGLWRRHWAGFLGAWFFIVLAPTSSAMPLADACFEHRMYVPLAALAALGVFCAYALLGRALDRFGPRGRTVDIVGCALVGAVALALAGATRARIADYQSEISIWRDAARVAYKNARARSNYGEAMRKAGQVEQAIVEFNAAIALDDTYPDAYNNLGSALGQRAGEALARAENAKKAADASMDGVRIAKAAKELDEAMHAAEATMKKAIEDFDKAADLKSRLNVRYPSVYSNRANAYQYLGMIAAAQGRDKEAKDYRERAIQDHNKAIEQGPEWPSPYLNRAVFYFEQKKYAQAWDDVDMYNKLGGQDSVKYRRFVQALSNASGRNFQGGGSASGAIPSMGPPER
ncbi:MAG: tetratricopeptide repeat protein [Phycisphaerae bacterium]